MILYDKFFLRLKEKNISQYQLINKYNMSAGQLDRIRKNKNITTNTIDVLCNILECDVNDLMEHIPDENNHF